MTPREKEIIGVLVNRVRVLNLEQVARTWWSKSPCGISRAKKTLDNLQADGWLRAPEAFSRPVKEMQRPLVDWRIGDRTPNFDRIEKQLGARAAKPSTKSTFLYATRKANQIFGRDRLQSVKLTQLTHDLGVAEIFLIYRHHSEYWRGWIAEDHLPKNWPSKQKPDALLQSERGRWIRAIEYGGAYKVDRLVELHNTFCNLGGIGVDYEIW